MKKIYYLLFIVIGLSGFNNNLKAQYGCFTPSLAVYDANSFSLISPVVPCTYTNYIAITPQTVFSGNNATMPCMQIKFNLTNPNSVTNNSLTMFQGTTAVTSLCSSFPAPCYTAIPNSTSYSFALAGLNPTQTHSYNLCNTNIAGSFNYSVTSCYSNIVLASGTWLNSSSNNCQGVTIPANAAIGTTAFTVTPAVPSTASITSPSGYLYLDTYQMTAGTYTITYFFNSQNVCTATATRTIQITNPFNASWTSISQQCQSAACINLNPQISGTSGGTFIGTGVTSNSFCPATSGAGTFPITYTVGITPQCGSSAVQNLTVNATPVANAGTAPASITCANPTQSLGGSGGGTYSWSGTGIVSGGATANPVVNGPGPFSLTVTSGAGCTSTNVTTVSVPVNTVLPTPSISSPTVLNCSNTSMNLTGSPSSGLTYTWSGPGIVSGGSTASPLINAGGTYSLGVTSTANGCSNGTTIAIAAPNTSIAILPATSGSVTCTNNTISLSTTNQAGQNYTWTAPGGASIVSGPNSAAATGSNSGTYSVSVFNTTNGCSQVGTIAANVNTTAPLPNATSSGTVTCASGAINLSSSTSAVTYTWVAPSGSSISGSPNVANASGSGPGTYTVNVTYTVNGCTNSNVVTVNTNTVKPTAVINSTPVITCANPTVTINGGPASTVSYSWTGGTIVGTNTLANVNVSSTGIYSLAVTSTSNGCTSTTPATVNITSNLATPALSAVGSQTAASGCGSSSVVILSANATPAGSSYSWTSSGGFASATGNSTVAVNGSTTYTVTSMHPVTGCSSSLVFTVNPSSGSPSITGSSSTSGTITCNNTTQSTTVTTNPSTGVTYAWTGPGIVGTSSTSAVTASLSGVYNMTVTNTSNNCTNVFSYNLSADNTPINPNASASNTVNCISTTASIVTAPTPTSSTFTYSWSTTATTSSVVVNPTANTNYVVTVTNTANGCVGSQTINVVANTIAPTAVSINPSNVTLACPAQTAFITGSATGATSYSWIAPAGGSILSGGNTATAQVTSSSIGTFSLIATGANGCSSAAAMATVSPNTNAPTFSLSNSNPSITCLTSSPNVTVGLTSTVTIQSYSWSPSAGIAGSNTLSTVTFTAAGIYTVTVEATNGCLSTSTVSVANATVSPSVVAGTGTAQTISCTNSIVTIAPTFTPGANLTYTWSGPGIVGSSNNANVQVNQNGSYSLTVTNTLTGCSSTSITIPVVGTNVPPTLNVSSSSSIGISCQPNTNTVTLTAASSGAVTYSWNTGATTPNINTSNAGTYTVTVTDGNSGCSATQTVAVANNTVTPTLNASASGNLPCGGSGTTTLNAISSSTNVSYVWNGPAITNGSNTANPEVAGAGVYTVLVTDNITGCTATQTVPVSSTSVLAAFSQNTVSGVAPLTVNFTNQSTGATTYSWNFGNGTSTQTDPSNIFNTAGTYTVTLISMNGACTATADVIITVKNSLGVIPEVFTPNGDGKNDVFEIPGLDSYPNNSLQIFNRWGNPVYNAKPYKNDWDGSPNTAGKTGSSKLPTSTYFYILDLGTGEATDVIRGFIQLQY